MKFSDRSIHAVAMVALVPVAARPPATGEHAGVEVALKAAGDAAWEEIGFDEVGHWEVDDGGHWEADDARGAGGKDHAPELDESYRIIDVDD